MLVSDENLTDEAYLERLQQSFPAVMNQQDDSTNQKLINIFSGIENYYKNQLLAMNDLNILENVKGDMLTQLALDWNIRRIDNDDGFLRFQIRFAMWKRHLGVGVNDIKEFIAFILNVKPNDFNINATGMEDIEVTDIPFNFSRSDHSDLKVDLLINALESVLPTEFDLTNVEFMKTSSMTLYLGIAVQHGQIKRVWQRPFSYDKSVVSQFYLANGMNGAIAQIKHVKQR
ncbi:hypothetical protein [Nicoliella lavandulae]|uniref:Uncharacterized protein n=1 Tax=Nicoliella lavandulae TaxID=3082954 RepID=A0ABU8SME2_9LACO